MTAPDFSQVYGRLSLPLLLLSETAKIVGCNAAAASLLRRPAGDLTGCNLGELLTSGASHLSGLLTRWESSLEFTPGALTFGLPGGKEITLRCDGARAGREPGAGILVQLTTKAEGNNRFLLLREQNQQLADEVRQRQRTESLLASQNEVLEMIAKGERLQSTLATLVRAVETYAGADMLASVLLLDETGERLRHGAAGRLPDSYIAAIDGVKIGPSVGSCGTAAFLGQPVIVSDIAADPLWADYKDLALAHGLRACWSTPIRSSYGELLGTFALYYREPREPNASALRLIGIAARTASIAIERARVAERMRALFGQQQATLDGLPASIVLVSSDGTIRLVNRAWIEWTRQHGLPELAAPGAAIAGYCARLRYTRKDGDSAELSSAVRPVMEGASEYLDVECAVEGCWLRVTAAPIRRTGGPPYDVVIMHIDITGRKAAEDALVTQTTELAKMNSELQQFAYVASHDMREPLRTVKTFAQLLVRRYRGQIGSDADEYLSYISEGITRMDLLLDDLLLYSRAVQADEQASGPVDVNLVIDAVVRNLTALIASSGAEVLQSNPMPVVLGNRSQITQVFQNLIENAIKYRGPEAPRIDVSSENADGKVVFHVRDNGLGIAPEYHERIFGLFQRLQRGVDGTGIGLALCKKIVENHGGRIWVDSRPQAGSTFSFTLPATQSTVSAA